MQRVSIEKIKSNRDYYEKMWKEINNYVQTTSLTDGSEGERSEPEISSQIARSVRALGYVELDYVGGFLFNLEAVKQVYVPIGITFQNGLGRANQNCTFCVHVSSCLYSTVQLPGATLA